MSTEQLELWTDNTLLRQIGDELVPKEVGIDPLRNPCGLRVLFDNLAQAPGRVGLAAVGCEEIRRSMLRLAFQVLGELPPKAGRKQHRAIFTAFPLGDADLARLQIDIGGAGAVCGGVGSLAEPFFPFREKTPLQFSADPTDKQSNTIAS